MTRSRRKPYITDSIWKKYKKHAVKKLRKTEDVTNNMNYKRYDKGNNFDDNCYMPQYTKLYRK